MAKHSKEDREVATLAQASKRTERNQAAVHINLAPDTEVSNRPEDLALACKPLQPGIPEDDKDVARLRANLRKMDYEGLLDVPWHHEEPEWLQEIRRPRKQTRRSLRQRRNPIRMKIQSQFRIQVVSGKSSSRGHPVRIRPSQGRSQLGIHHKSTGRWRNELDLRRSCRKRT
jgi:hypothetical protein